jgi:hypothetical protein
MIESMLDLLAIVAEESVPSEIVEAKNLRGNL